MAPQLFAEVSTAGGLAIIVGCVIAVAITLAVVYAVLIKRTRRDNAVTAEEHRPGPGRS